MELTWYRSLIIAVALAVVVAGLWSRWRSGDLVDTYRQRALELCPARLVAQGLTGGTDGLQVAMAEEWDWGRFEIASSLFADVLDHRDDTFEAVRASLYQPLADGPDGESRCRLAMCVYSVPLDATAASVHEGRCGGMGGHRLVIPGLMPDILDQPYR